MRADNKESFRKWATLIVSALALLVTCLRDPIILTLKSTVREVIREEMDKYEKNPLAGTRPDKRGEADADLLKRLDQEVAAIRDLTIRNAAEHNTWSHVNACLLAIEAKLDQLSKTQQQNTTPQRDKN